MSGSTKKTGVIGWPVEGSLSPAIHNAGYAALGLDWVYLPLPVPPGEVANALVGLPALGFVGANVTMPHKTEVAALVGDLSEDAARLQAVNTIAVHAGALAGHNTDAPGFDRFLRFDAGFDPRGRTALLFGAGGAARACALALARGELATLVVAARDENQADALRAAVDGLGTTVRTVSFDAAREVSADLVVNATPVGAAGEELPLPPLGAGATVVDLLYRPALTPLLARAKAAGAAAFGGLGLLLHQAAMSFELWTGLAPPLPVMSAAALSKLAETSS
ncbi:MAG TPA: shikimate dehydrogenase [Actinomycetota bacterium]